MDSNGKVSDGETGEKESTAVPPPPPPRTAFASSSSSSSSSFAIASFDVAPGESEFHAYLRRTTAHGLSRIVKRSDSSRFVWIAFCVAIYGITVLIFGLMAQNYNDPDELVIQLDLEEVCSSTWPISMYSGIFVAQPTK